MNDYEARKRDPLFDVLQRNSDTNFFRDIRNYLLDEYSSNFTYFAETIYENTDIAEWNALAKMGLSVDSFVDDVYSDYYAASRQRNSALNI